jgi:hypothetical protein
MHKKKNQKPTTNLVVQKQADTSQVKKPKPTQAPPIPQKEEDKFQNIKLFKMRKQERQKYQYFHILNIKLRNKLTNKDLKEEDYVRIFKEMNDKKIHSESSASKHCIFRSMFLEKENNIVKYITGTLAQFTYISNERWFNLNSLDIDEEFKVPNGLFPDAKITEIVFVPKAHRMVYKLSSEFKTNPYTIKKFLETSLNQVCNDNEYVQVDVETDTSTIEKIISAHFLKKNLIDINYSNFDFGGDIKDFIENDIRASNSSRLRIEATQKPNNSINVKDSKILTGALESSISNGESVATIIDGNGRVNTIKTSNYPRKEFVHGVISSFHRLAYEKIINIFRKNGN